MPMIWLLKTTSNGGGFEMSFQNIDLHRRCIEIFREHGLTPFRSIIDAALFKSLAPKKQRSSTILVPEVVFWLMASVGLGDGTMTAAVRKFWTPLVGAFPGLSLEPVTDAAFCTARKGLSLDFFANLFRAVYERFQRTFRDRYRWKGLRLWGIDGSTLSLSSQAKKLREIFPSTTSAKRPSKNPLALMVSLVGLRDGVCKDFEMVPVKVSEQECARRLILRSLGIGDLILFDKNFVGFETIACLLSQKADFLFRLTSNKFTAQARRLTPSGRKEEGYITLPLPKKIRRERPDLPETVTLRILDYQIPGFRPSRLLTSLIDVERYPYEEVAPLYHERWMHETVYREWKQTLQISNLRSHSREGVLKEVYVQLTLNNAIRWIMAEAAGEDRRPVDLQFLNTKRLILGLIPIMANLEPEDLARLYRRMVATIATFEIRKRPGRSYPRSFDQKPRHKGGGRYLQPARIMPQSEGTYDFV
jgi:hypothetical protein